MIVIAAIEFLDEQLIPGASSERTAGMRNDETLRGVEMALDPELRLVHLWRGGAHRAVPLERVKAITFRKPPTLKKIKSGTPEES